MTKPTEQISTLNYYYQSPSKLPSDARNYLKMQVAQLQSFGNSVQDYASDKMQQISTFPTRAKGFYSIIDQTAYASYKGTIIGGLIGFFTGGMLGAYIGMQYGSSIGATMGFFNALNAFADSIIESAGK